MQLMMKKDIMRDMLDQLREIPIAHLGKLEHFELVRDEYDEFIARLRVLLHEKYPNMRDVCPVQEIDGVRFRERHADELFLIRVSSRCTRFLGRGIEAIVKWRDAFGRVWDITLNDLEGNEAQERELAELRQMSNDNEPNAADSAPAPKRQGSEPTDIHSPLNACMYQQHCKRLEQQASDYASAFAAACAFIDAHVGDPDMTPTMVRTFAEFQKWREHLKRHNHYIEPR